MPDELEAAELAAPAPYYDEGGITIYHADCRAVLPVLGDQTIDHTITDPPYEAEAHLLQRRVPACPRQTHG